jgi:hypothetical protein
MLGNYEMRFYEDEYNVHGKRNRKNTEREDYNCGGYALQTFSWILPCEDEGECAALYDFDMWECDYDEDDFNESAERGAEWMLNNIPNLRQVSSPDEELEEGEWLIGFKVGAGSDFGGDFHYIKRTPSGRFYHKPGASKVRRMSKAEALSDNWCDGAYTSTTIWFARKK